MRILFLDKSPIWLSGLPNGFRDLGHEIGASGPLTEQNIPKIIEGFNPDLIFTIGWGSEQTTRKQDWIRQYAQSAGVPLIYWATEDPHFTRSFTLPLIMRMQPDFVFTISHDMVDFYKKLGIRAAHLDFGYHPTIHRRVECQEQFRCSIAVVANAYPDVLKDAPQHYRNQSLKTLLQPLLKENIRIDIWGRNWEEMKPFIGQNIPQKWMHGYLSYVETHNVYSSADIVIGLQNYETQVTQRTYEILGSEGFLLTVDTPAVRSLFKPGRDLVVSSSPEETLHLVDYYLQHPDEREQIQKQGRLTVADHCYKHRAEYVVQILHEEGLLNGQSCLSYL